MNITTISDKPLFPLDESSYEPGDCIYINNAKKTLGDSIGGGGEGTVFEIVGDRNTVAKLYHKKIINQRQIEKLKLITRANLATNTLVVPRCLVLDSPNGKVIGYTMAKAEGKKLDEILLTDCVEAKTKYSKREMVQLACNIAKAYAELDSNKQYSILAGDINPNNILVYDRTKVRLIDLDSIQINEFPCPVGFSGYNMPSAIGRDYKTFLRTPDNEQFALAVLLFYILIYKHPFAQLNGEDDDYNIKNLPFQYKLNENETKNVPQENIYRWMSLSDALQKMFYNTFNSAKTSNFYKIPIATWEKELSDYYKIVEIDVKNHKLLDIWLLREDPLSNKKVCPACGKPYVPAGSSPLCPECQAKGLVECSCANKNCATPDKRYYLPANLASSVKYCSDCNSYVNVKCAVCDKIQHVHKYQMHTFTACYCKDHRKAAKTRFKNAETAFKKEQTKIETMFSSEQFSVDAIDSAIMLLRSRMTPLRQDGAIEEVSTLINAIWKTIIDLELYRDDYIKWFGVLSSCYGRMENDEGQKAIGNLCRIIQMFPKMEKKRGSNYVAKFSSTIGYKEIYSRFEDALKNLCEPIVLNCAGCKKDKEIFTLNKNSSNPYYCNTCLEEKTITCHVCKNDYHVKNYEIRGKYTREGKIVCSSCQKKFNELVNNVSNFIRQVEDVYRQDKFYQTNFDRQMRDIMSTDRTLDEFADFSEIIEKRKELGKALLDSEKGKKLKEVTVKYFNLDVTKISKFERKSWLSEIEAARGKIPEYYSLGNDFCGYISSSLNQKECEIKQNYIRESSEVLYEYKGAYSSEKFYETDFEDFLSKITYSIYLLDEVAEYPEIAKQQEKLETEKTKAEKGKQLKSETENYIKSRIIDIQDRKSFLHGVRKSLGELSSYRSELDSDLLDYIKEELEESEKWIKQKYITEAEKVLSDCKNAYIPEEFHKTKFDDLLSKIVEKIGRLGEVADEYSEIADLRDKLIAEKTKAKWGEELQKKTEEYIEPRDVDKQERCGYLERIRGSKEGLKGYRAVFPDLCYSLLKKIEENETHIKDEYKTEASGIFSVCRDAYRPEKFYTINFRELQDSIGKSIETLNEIANDYSEIRQLRNDLEKEKTRAEASEELQKKTKECIESRTVDKHKRKNYLQEIGESKNSLEDYHSKLLTIGLVAESDSILYDYILKILNQHEEEIIDVYIRESSNVLNEYRDVYTPEKFFQVRFDDELLPEIESSLKPLEEVAEYSEIEKLRDTLLESLKKAKRGRELQKATKIYVDCDEIEVKDIESYLSPLRELRSNLAGSCFNVDSNLTDYVLEELKKREAEYTYLDLHNSLKTLDVHAITEKRDIFTTTISRKNIKGYDVERAQKDMQQVWSLVNAFDAAEKNEDIVKKHDAIQAVAEKAEEYSGYRFCDEIKTVLQKITLEYNDYIQRKHELKELTKKYEAKKRRLRKGLSVTTLCSISFVILLIIHLANLSDGIL